MTTRRPRSGGPTGGVEELHGEGQHEEVGHRRGPLADAKRRGLVGATGTPRSEAAVDAAAARLPGAMGLSAGSLRVGVSR